MRPHQAFIPLGWILDLSRLAYSEPFSGEDNVPRFLFWYHILNGLTLPENRISIYGAFYASKWASQSGT